jgi:hypothetical protein
MVKRAGSATRAGDTVPIEEQIRCVDRELALRRSFYPREVQAGRMRLEVAQRETWAMQGVLDTLRACAGQPTAIQPELMLSRPRERRVARG